MTWIYFALGSAFFAALVSILAKIGMEGVSSHLATAIRTVVIVVFAWGMTFADGSIKSLWTLTPRTVWFLVLSGLATGMSWMMYFRALQLGPASSVAPIDKVSLIFTLLFAMWFLHEKPTIGVIIGTLCILVGVLFIVLWK